MKLDVFALIHQKYDNLSKVNRKLADFVLQNHSAIVFISIVELGRLAEVSPASITRFSKELGYSGFPAFQKDLQIIIKKEVIDRKEIRFSLLDAESDDVLSQIISGNIENLKSTLTEDLSKEFKKAVDAITDSEDVYIIGLRSSYTVAYYFYFLLRETRENIHLITLGTGDVYDTIANITHQSVLLAIGFPKYTRETMNILAFFNKNNAKVISVTDSYSSPLSVLSDITLVAVNKKNTYSFVSAMSILNALVVSIGRKAPTKALDILDRKDAILKEMGIHI